MEPDEPEMQIDSILPIHYKFRFTFTEQDKTYTYNEKIPRWRTISQRLLEELLQYCDLKHLLSVSIPPVAFFIVVILLINCSTINYSTINCIAV